MSATVGTGSVVARRADEEITMHNEPVDFDPAAKEIAHELRRLLTRIRGALRPGGARWPEPDSAR